MTAREFFEAFKSIFDDPAVLPRLQEAWRDRARFTKEVMPKIVAVLSGKSLETQQEYYNIDVIGWSDHTSELNEIKKPEGIALRTHFWHLDVAVEHENDQRDWTDELVKLLYINCPLRVVIGYYPEAFSGDELEATVAYASRIVSLANKDMDLIREGQRYLLILGRNHKDPERLSGNTYSAYIYNNEERKFIDL